MTDLLSLSAFGPARPPVINHCSRCLRHIKDAALQSKSKILLETRPNVRLALRLSQAVEGPHLRPILGTLSNLNRARCVKLQIGRLAESGSCEHRAQRGSNPHLKLRECIGSDERIQLLRRIPGLLHSPFGLATISARNSRIGREIGKADTSLLLLLTDNLAGHDCMLSQFESPNTDSSDDRRPDQ